MKSNQVENIFIKQISYDETKDCTDLVAVEEPLEIQLIYSTVTGRMLKNVAITMRTPGNDKELAAGFLFTEGVIQNNGSVREIKQSGSDENRIQVILHENSIPQLNNADRNFYSTSSCGICGKTSIEAIRTTPAFHQKPDSITVSADLLYGLQDQLKNQQVVFENTGGIHASALFDLNARFILLREDVGRHNALDKVVGEAFLTGKLPLENHLLFLSGRASFELLQKAAMAGIKIVIAVGAPSSLAVELAKEMDLTLIGFLRNDRFNIYSGHNRILY